MIKKWIFGFCSFFCAGLIFAQVQLSYNGSGNYTLVERTDLRRYDNGRYIGLTSREVRSFIARTPSVNQNDTDSYFDGNFYVLEKTQHNRVDAAKRINTAIPSKFKISKDGELIMIEDNGYPSFRSFPSYSTHVLRAGDSWQAYAERSVDPLNKGVFTRMKMLVNYTYLKDDFFHNEEVFVLKASWATRYSGEDFEGDADLLRADGNHEATMYVSKATGNALVVRDSVNEQFTYSDGNKIAFKGTISLFTEYPPTVNREELEPAIKRIQIASDSDISVDETAAGLRLTMRNIQFKPDSAELLPGEKARVAKIAEVLKLSPSSMFLIEGHTANTGTTDGDKELSEARAEVIAEMLSAYGIPSDRFICKGSGSRYPIASNETPEGRAINRRVEITILLPKGY